MRCVWNSLNWGDRILLRDVVSGLPAAGSHCQMLDALAKCNLEGCRLNTSERLPQLGHAVMDVTQLGSAALRWHMIRWWCTSGLCIISTWADAVVSDNLREGAIIVVHARERCCAANRLVGWDTRQRACSRGKLQITREGLPRTPIGSGAASPRGENRGKGGMRIASRAT